MICILYFEIAHFVTISLSFEAFASAIRANASKTIHSIFDCGIYDGS